MSRFIQLAWSLQAPSNNGGKRKEDFTLKILWLDLQAHRWWIFRVKRLKVFLFFFLFSFFFSLAFATDYPFTITDEMDRTVTIEAEPQRIISMLPSHTETLCALDACDKLIGVDDFSNYPPEVDALPKLGGGLTGYDGGPDVEGIVALEPDLVLVSEYGDLAQLLEQAGLTVYAGSPQSYDDTFLFFEVLGQLTNKEIEATLLTDKVQKEVEAISNLVAGAESVSVYYEIDSTPYSVGPDSFIGVLLNKAGGQTIVTAEQGDFPQLDPEFIISSNPQVIILSDAPSGESIETLKARPGWENLQAIQNNKVFALTAEQNDLANRPGPRIAEVVRLFAQMLHPDLVD
jgi:iron complex transport system substrate-binding protein